MPKWDTFALSRFEDIWQVLEVNDGTFVATEGTLPPASVLAQHNDGPSTTRRCTRCRFTRCSHGFVRRDPSFAFPAFASEVGRRAGSQNPQAGQRAPRRVAGARILRPDAGVRRHSCGFDGMRTTRPARRSRSPSVGRCQCRQPGRARRGRRHRASPAQLSRIPHTGGRAPPSRLVRRRVAVVDGLLGYRLPDGSPLSDVEVATQMLCIFIGGTETVPKIVAHGLWELSQRPDQMTAVCADPATNVSVAREEMIRYCAPAQWFARTVRRPYTIHGQTIEPGQRVITLLASANRDEREYPEPDEFIWDRPIRRSLAFGRGQHFCIGYHLARLEIDVLLAEWLRRVPDSRSKAMPPPGSVQLPVGMEQHPGGGLTCGPTGSSPPISLSARRSPTRLPTTSPMAKCCCGFWPPVSAAANAGLSWRQGATSRGTTGERRGERRLSDPRNRRRGDRQPASPNTVPVITWWAGPPGSTA